MRQRQPTTHSVKDFKKMARDIALRSIPQDLNADSNEFPAALKNYIKIYHYAFGKIKAEFQVREDPNAYKRMGIPPSQG